MTHLAFMTLSGWVIVAIVAGALLVATALAYIATSPVRALIAWLATLGIQAEIGAFHLGVSDVLAIPLAMWGVLLMIERPPALTKLRVTLLAFAGIFLTWAHLTAMFYRGHLSKWTYVNKDVGLLEMLLCVGAIISIVDSRERLRQASEALTAGGSALNLVGLLLALISLRTGFGGFVLYDGLRYVGFMADPNAWAGFLAVIAIFQLCLLIFDQKERTGLSRTIQWINVGFLVIGVFVSMSRGAMASLIVGMACTLIFMTPRRRLAVGSGMTLIGALVSIPLWGSGLISTVVDRISEPGGVAIRVEINRAAWDMYTSSVASMTTGVGIGTFLDSAPKLGLVNQIHNSFLWLLVEGGPLLLLAFLAILGLAIAQTVKGTKAPVVSVVAIAIFCSLASCLVLFNTVEGLYQRQFWLLVALPDVLAAISERVQVFTLSVRSHGDGAVVSN
jgi:hypothetical protein